MKKVLFIASALMFLASCGEGKKESTSSAELPEVEDMKFAYYIEDSISGNYTYFLEAQAAIEQKVQAFQQRLYALQQQLQQKAGEYQRGQSSNSLSQNQILAYEREIGTLQQQMQYLQESEGSQLEMEQMEGTYALFERIKKYGKEYAEEKGITIFLSDKIGGQLLYMDPSMDVTMDFIEFMNDREKQISGE